MQMSICWGGLALAALAAAQTSTGQACPSNEVSIFESCICPYGTDFQYSNTYATLGVSAADFNKYTSSCKYQPYLSTLWLKLTLAGQFMILLGKASPT